MILTLFYMASTSYNAYKLRSFYLKLKQASEKSSIVFYQIPKDLSGVPTTPAASDLCSNQLQAKISSVIWFNENSRGCSVMPVQKVNLGPFISFPKLPNMIPFNYSIKESVCLNDSESVYCLLETADLTDLNKTFVQHDVILEMENYGELLAWKIDERLSILLKTDARKFSELLFVTFMQENYIFNDNLKLLRIQSVDVDGEPQSYELIMNHTRKDLLNRSKQFTTVDQFAKHLESIKTLGVLANQAFEFEYKKNLTEGKTGIVQPDLIPSKSIEELNNLKSPDTPKKVLLSMEKTSDKLSELRKDLKVSQGESSRQPMKVDMSFPKKVEKSNFGNKSGESSKFPETATKTVRINLEPIPPQDLKKSPTKLTGILINSEKTASPRKDNLPSTSKGILIKKEEDLVKAESKIEVKPEVVTKIESKSAPEITKIETKTAPKEDTKVEAKSEPIVVTKTDSKPATEAASKIETKPILPVVTKPLPLPVDVVKVEKEKDKPKNTAELKKQASISVPPTVDTKKSGAKIEDSKKLGTKPKEKVETPKKSSKDSEKTKSFLDKEKEMSKSTKKIEEKTKTVTSKEKPKLTPLKTSTPAPESPASSASAMAAASTSKSFSSQSLRRRKLKNSSKPPNILVYSDSSVTRNNVIKTLGNLLEENMYTIYPLDRKQVHEKIFVDNATLLVVCGTVPPEISDILLDFFFKGGKMLCLCSDLLHNVLPTYTTAEVREHEMVQFSYGKWKNIKMMHHIFCYQPSPVRKHFSQESDDPPKVTTERPSLVNLPRSVELVDLQGVKRLLQVQVLAAEETWQTPSLLLVYDASAGKIVFSQVHLEVDPALYENDEQKYEILKKNDGLRLEILTDVLKTHLGICVRKESQSTKKINYSPGYFLGRHELKFELLESLKSKMETENLLKNANITLKFCGKNVSPPKADQDLLPILIHSCPDDFSTLEYYETLNTEQIGRLVIYCPVVTSSMHIVNGQKYVHGLAVIPRQQSSGTGRSNNQWLSPEGCLMFSLQLHIPMKSTLGQKISLLQHVIATAVVHSFLKQTDCQDLNIKLKWPNDIYVNNDTKLGGLLINTQIEGDMAVCNIGCGLNFNNSVPTACINDLVKAYNKTNSKNLPLFSYEKSIASIFNEIESLINRIESESDFKTFFELYYKYWLHSDSSVTIKSREGVEKTAKILGLDEYGYLKIQLDNSTTEVVHPDGNSFDMLRGLILPKNY